MQKELGRGAQRKLEDVQLELEKLETVSQIEVENLLSIISANC